MGRLERAAARARLGLWEYDSKSATLIGSHTVDKIVGLPTQNGVGWEDLTNVLRGESSQTLKRAIQLAQDEDKPFSLVSEIQTTAGERKWVRITGERCSEGVEEPPVVVGTFQDISDIRLLDRITQESEMTLTQVEQITHIGHWSVSLANGEIFHSDEIKRIFGYEPSEYALSVEDAVNAYHPDDRDEVIRLFNRAVETGEGYEFDLRVIQPSGSVRHVHSKGYTEKNDDGEVTRVYGVFQDITPQVLAEQALRDGRASIAALIDVVHTAIVVHDKDGKVELSNAMANRLLAPLSSKVVGTELEDPAWQFISEDETPLALEDLPVSRILRTKAALEGEVLGRVSGDSTRWLLVNGVPVLDELGSLAKVIVSFVDITERRELEARVHQSEKMKAIGHLAGGVAHDFNNQLMIMMNFAELLKATLPKSSKERGWVEGILSGGGRSAQLTKQLLAFARKGKYVVTNVDLNQLVLEVVEMANHSFDKKIHIHHQLEPGRVTVSGDASQLQNALLNLALNSRDAMPQGGELTLTTKVAATLKTYDDGSEGAAVPEEWVELTVEDTGAGMDPATRDHIFEPFFTTKELGKGTGMGLASVYGTIETHQGTISVDSCLGKGTLIKLRLPLVHAPKTHTSPPVSERPSPGAHILIIDDEEGIVTSMSQLLEHRGYQTTTFSSARAALRHFKTHWNQIDLVLLDMIMPERSGTETFTELQAIHPQVKVLLVSGYSFTEEAKKLRDAGACGFLVKPVAAEKLLGSINEAMQPSSSDR